MSGDGIPVLLTVEEAGELLRVGRTKAYAMAREWRETDGRSGLPVIDLGHVLRVPRPALEELIGADLSEVVGHSQVKGTEPAALAANLPNPTNGPTKAEAAEPSVTTPRTRRRRNRIANQLDLFDSNPKSS